MIYLDNAATSMSKPPQVYEAVLHAMKTCASLGRSGHEAALRAAEVAYDCRTAAAQFFDADPEQVVFTSNATHGLNIAIHSLVRPGDRVVVSGFEHNAVMRPLYHIGADVVVAGTTLFDPADTLEAFRKAITPDTRAVICTHVSNVFGYILPVDQIAHVCRMKKIPFVLDASQSAGVLPVSLGRTGAAFIAMPGHKSLLGPQGTGILICGQMPKPFLIGGTGSNSLNMGMPDFLPDMEEVGTHNVPGIAGLCASLKFLQSKGIEPIRRSEQQLLVRLCSALSGRNDVRIFYGGERIQTGVLSIQILNMDCETAALKLSEAGIAVRSGLHCAPLAHRSAGTLEQGTIRISVSGDNTTEDMDTFTQELERILPVK